VGATVPRGVVDFLGMKGDLGLGEGFWQVGDSQFRLSSMTMQ